VGSDHDRIVVAVRHGTEAERRTVKLGRNSVSTIEILDGLREGDQVIISDTSSLDSYPRIRIR